MGDPGARSRPAGDIERVRRTGEAARPLGYLESLVAPDGSVRYSRTGAQTPVWVTAQAMTALAEKPLPIAPVSAVRAGPARSPGREVSPPEPRPADRAITGLQAGTSALRALLMRVLSFLER